MINPNVNEQLITIHNIILRNISKEYKGIIFIRIQIKCEALKITAQYFIELNA